MTKQESIAFLPVSPCVGTKANPTRKRTHGHRCGTHVGWASCCKQRCLMLEPTTSLSMQRKPCTLPHPLQETLLQDSRPCKTVSSFLVWVLSRTLKPLLKMIAIYIPKLLKIYVTNKRTQITNINRSDATRNRTLYSDGGECPLVGGRQAHAVCEASPLSLSHQGVPSAFLFATRG